MRLQETIRLIFERFRKLGSARQVMLSLAADEVHFPRPSDGKKMVSFDWTSIRYRNVISVLKNPFYAGVYAYGKSEKRTSLVEGRLRKTYKHRKPLDQWDVMVKEHHALCATPAAEATPGAEMPLPVFPLQARPRSSTASSAHASSG